MNIFLKKIQIFLYNLETDLIFQTLKYFKKPYIRFDKNRIKAYPFHQVTLHFDQGRLVDMKFYDIAYEGCPDHHDTPELISTHEQLPFIKKNETPNCYEICSENASEPTKFEGRDENSAN